MAQRTSHNQIGFNGYVTVVSDASGYLNLNDGTFPANGAGEVVASMTISKIVWGSTSTNSWTVKRGGNTVAVLTGSGSVDYQELGIGLEAGGDNQANVVFTLSGGTGAIAVKVHKSSNTYPTQ